ncbi:heme-binding protein [Tenacibaculum finnmarkense]|uniref:GlcG/HbpS family heme-binding protein n=1 Tax=Tenacibaculum finnmarkense TaxID=2781243 RepID=UPI000C620EF5|nr:heme-binding protein [Tenacibaculum finnmarkense]MBE7659593.1 heme-binding protein [Tenacibaculum finnmarkense genomovar finnmarkense]MCD8438551.1 heme-binding protein [Tenacibaculum finnmarkense genomovar ulcerans]MCD8453470.1 heme-binding protein [Tenacibaculum finnmarkense genomovar ulcerans]MCG8719483.1 heme-binding protein [Tenacibaculum finnmarkense]MCG8816331.1 heme-binding protein [Tenacibaculum finnmarkense]
MNITLSQAKKVLATATIKAISLNTKMSISVVDAGANLVAFERMDGAFLGPIDIAMKKAKTAALFGKNTDVLGTLSQPGQPLYNIEHSNNGMITFAGGIPIKNSDGVLIGAIGVSGSTVENDFKVAQAGVNTLLKTVKL